MRPSEWAREREKMWRNVEEANLRHFGDEFAPWRAAKARVAREEAAVIAAYLEEMEAKQ